MIANEYYEWLKQYVYDDSFVSKRTYEKLFLKLFNTDFVCLIEMDENRASDGVGLRYRFAYNNCYDPETLYSELGNKPCSVLEMMIGLCIRCEIEIMSNSSEGDRTGLWFWEMIVNLGLADMSDDRYDERHVSYILDRFLRREYDPDGRGGLFYIPNFTTDLRKMEIWLQMNYWFSYFEVENIRPSMPF